MKSAELETGEDAPLLVLSPGRHTARVAILIDPRDESEPGIRVVTDPVKFTITDPAEAEAG